MLTPLEKGVNVPKCACLWVCVCVRLPLMQFATQQEEASPVERNPAIQSTRRHGGFSPALYLGRRADRRHGASAAEYAGIPFTWLGLTT